MMMVSLSVSVVLCVSLSDNVSASGQSCGDSGIINDDGDRVSVCVSRSDFFCVATVG